MRLCQREHVFFSGCYSRALFQISISRIEDQIMFIER